MRAGLYEDAIPDFSLVIRILPEFAEAYYGRGVSYFRQEDPVYNLALEDLDKAIELSPGMANAYRERGALYTAQEDKEQAIADLEKAISLYDDAREAFDLAQAIIMLEELKN